MLTKTCTKCSAEKDLDEFHRSKRGVLGRKPRCKACSNETQRNHYVSNKDRILAQQKEYVSRNEDAIRARQQRWVDDNRARVTEQKQRWIDRNPEKRREVNRSWAQRNYSVIRQWRKKNPEKIAEYARRYYENNIEKCHSIARQRRARVRNLPQESYTSSEIFDRDNWVCQLCDNSVPRVTKWPHPESPTIDHIVPISNPNCPGDVKSNIQLAHWYCNLKKGNRIE